MHRLKKIIYLQRFQNLSHNINCITNILHLLKFYHKWQTIHFLLTVVSPFSIQRSPASLPTMAVLTTQLSFSYGFKIFSLHRLFLCLSISLMTMTDERFHLQNILLRAKFLYTDSHDYHSKSLTSLSLDTGISTANLSKIFSGVQVPTATNLIKILSALDCYLVVYCRGVPQFMRRCIFQNFSDEFGNIRDSERWRLRQNEGNTVFPEDEHLFSSSDFKQPEFVNPNLFHPNVK